MSVSAFISEREAAYVDELSELARIPSVSATGTGMREAIAFLERALARRGFKVDVVETAGNPVIVGTAGSGSKTLLLYNHYDVQPPEPLDLWVTPPFEPTLRDGALFARGVIDDKGEIVARLAAIDALIARYGSLPLNVTFMIEGEEEIGSRNLEPFILENRERLKADACLWEAGMVDDEGRPQIWLGVRGILYVDLVCRTLAHDAHSGWAHALPNAAWRLVHALATLKGTDERIAIEGIYDSVIPPSESQERLLREMPPEDDNYRREYALSALAANREGYELRRSVFLPTCNISGVWSGFTGEGSKTVVPAEAYAKIDFRLVPGQRPADVLELLRAHLRRHGYGDITVTSDEGQDAATVDPDDPFIRVAVSAAEEVYGKRPIVSPLVGGTGPASFFRNHLGVPFVSLGCSYPGGRKHAPNEHIRLDDFVRGATCIARLMETFAQQ